MNDDLISRQAAIRWVKTECNPYGKPTLDFESGKKVIEHLEQMPSARQDSKESSFTHKALDLIERQAAIDLVRDVCNAVMSGCESWHEPETKDEVYEDIREVDAILKCNKEVRIALRNMPSAQPDFDITVKIDKAYDDGYEAGYLQGRHDWGDWDDWDE